MPYTVFTTNQPDIEKTIDDAELVDLIRMGLLVSNKGDIGPNGTLKKRSADDNTPAAVLTAAPASLSTPGGLASPTTTES